MILAWLKSIGFSFKNSLWELIGTVGNSGGAFQKIPMSSHLFHAIVLLGTVAFSWYLNIWSLTNIALTCNETITCNLAKGKVYL